MRCLWQLELPKRPILQPSASLRQPASRALLVSCSALQAKGLQFPATSLTLSRQVGQGSYGQVFEGWVSGSKQQPEHVILKRVKLNVEASGAEEMGVMEHLLNVYCSKKAKSSVAEFLGFCQVEPHEANKELTAGVWLVWRFQGSSTLAHYLRRRDCMEALAQDLQVPKHAVSSVVMRQIFEAVGGLHDAGLVHRDIKPANLVLALEERRFKLIDLGACADLRLGTNYVPDESILDMQYCPPEQYCMPTDSPNLARHLRPLALAMSPVLWARHKPDRFDSFSCGLVLMQLAMPSLRSQGAFKAFNVALRACNCNLLTWRASARLSASQTAILDAEGGAGWDLAAALLQPRRLHVGEDGSVGFINAGRLRLPVKAAMKHRFCAQAAPAAVATAAQQEAAAAAAATPPQAGTGFLSLATAAWRAASSQMTALESKIRNQALAVEEQTTRVVQLRNEASTGKVSVSQAQLQQEENLLGRMQGRLSSLRGDFSAAAASAQSLFASIQGHIGSRTGEQKVAASVHTSAPQQQQQQQQQNGQSLLRKISLRREAPGAQPSGSGLTSVAKPVPSAPRSAASTSAPAQAPANIAAQGLQFGGFALRGAASLAGALGREAGKAIAKLDAENKARAQEKVRVQAATLDFEDMLRTLQPLITPQARWQDIAPRMAADARFQALTARQRRLAFDSHLEALLQAQSLALEQARKQYLAAMRAADLPVTATWAQVAAAVPAASVLSDSDRREAYNDFTRQRRREAALETALASATPPIQAGDDWRQVRKRVSTLPSFQDLQEAERRTIIRAFLAGLQEAGTSTSAATTSQLLSEPVPDLAQAAPPQEVADELQMASAQLNMSHDDIIDSQVPAEALLASATDSHQGDGSIQELAQQMSELLQPAESATEHESAAAVVADEPQPAGGAQMALLEAMRREQREMCAAYEASMRDMTARLMEMEGRLRESNMLSQQQQQHVGSGREHETANGPALNGKA